MNTHGPRPITQRLTQRDIKVAGEARIDTRLGHRHLLHGVQALFRVQRGDLLVAVEHANGRLVRREVRSFVMHRAFEDELIAAKRQRLPRSQAQIALRTLVAGEYHANGTDRQPEVRQMHAPVAWREAAHALEQTLVARLVQQITDASDHHPGRQQGHRKYRPVEVTEQQRAQTTKHYAGDQHWGEHAEQPLQRSVLPAHQDSDTQRQHQRANQRNEHRIEVRWTDGKLGTGQCVQQQRMTTGARMANSVSEPPTTISRKIRMNTPRSGSVANACTDVSTPERTRKVPSRLSENAAIASNTVQLLNTPRFSVTANE